MKKTGALEHADQQQVAALVVGRDLGSRARPRARRASPGRSGSRRPPPRAPSGSRAAPPSRPAPRREPGTGDDFCARVRRGATPRVQTAGILASTNTSCTFLRRPASLSPGRQLRTLRPASSDSIVHGPQRTRPSSATGSARARRGQYSRTAVRPWPRSMRPEPPAERRAGRSSLTAAARRGAAGSARRPGWSGAAAAAAPRGSRPRRVLGVRAVAPELQSPRRGSRPRSPRRQSVSNGRTTPSSRFGLMPFALPLATSR